MHLHLDYLRLHLRLLVLGASTCYVLPDIMGRAWGSVPVGGPVLLGEGGLERLGTSSVAVVPVRNALALPVAGTAPGCAAL